MSPEFIYEDPTTSAAIKESKRMSRFVKIPIGGPEKDQIIQAYLAVDKIVLISSVLDNSNACRVLVSGTAGEDDLLPVMLSPAELLNKIKSV